MLRLTGGARAEELLERVHFEEPHVGDDAAAESTCSGEARKILRREIEPATASAMEM